MKMFMIYLGLLITLTTTCFADSKVIGTLEAGCPIQGQVIKIYSRFEEKLLIVEDYKVHELSLFKKQPGGISYFRSHISTAFPPTFEARVMSANMSRLSEVTVYLSGIRAECLIEVR
jgi:hypothetical protein